MGLAMLTWLDYVRMTREQRRSADVAAMHLACAVGLPDSDWLQPEVCLRRLDEDAAFVKDFTEHHFPVFREQPETWGGFEPRFRVWALVRSLQKHKGVLYNPAKTAKDAVFETADYFLFGIVQGQGGSCASLPVYFTAVGRRLGYPLKLASTRGEPWSHLFCRWDDGKDYFNLETSAGVLAYPPDEHYRTGQYENSAETIELGRLLVSKTPEDELCGFLCQRAHRWVDFGNYREAMRTFFFAKAVQPLDGFLDNNVAMIRRRWGDQLRERQPPGFPPIHCVYTRPRQFPEEVPLQWERDYLCLGIAENLLADPRYAPLWKRMRRKRNVPGCPSEFYATFHGNGTCSVRANYGPAEAADGRVEGDPLRQIARWTDAVVPEYRPLSPVYDSFPERISAAEPAGLEWHCGLRRPGEREIDFDTPRIITDSEGEHHV
jgi:hypothetical protein